MSAAIDDPDPLTSAHETDGEASEASANSAILPRRRYATIYDAVAGNKHFSFHLNIQMN